MLLWPLVVIIRLPLPQAVEHYRVGVVDAQRVYVRLHVDAEALARAACHQGQPHCLEPHGDGPQFSLRVDGRFTPEFRELIASRGRFGSQKVPTEGGLEDVLRAATVEAGPRFLSEENPEPDSDEDDEEENEEEDLEVEVEDEQTKRQLKEKEEAEEGGAGAGGELERGELP